MKKNNSYILYFFLYLFSCNINEDKKPMISYEICTIIKQEPSYQKSKKNQFVDLPRNQMFFVLRIDTRDSCLINFDIQQKNFFCIYDNKKYVTHIPIQCIPTKINTTTDTSMCFLFQFDNFIENHEVNTLYYNIKKCSFWIVNKEDTLQVPNISSQTLRTNILTNKDVTNLFSACCPTSTSLAKRKCADNGFSL